MILKLLDGGQWSTSASRKASHCYDPIHGWAHRVTRIREVGGGKWMMTMHGMFWGLPARLSCRRHRRSRAHRQPLALHS